MSVLPAITIPAYMRARTHTHTHTHFGTAKNTKHTLYKLPLLANSSDVMRFLFEVNMTWVLIEAPATETPTAPSLPSTTSHNDCLSSSPCLP